MIYKQEEVNLHTHSFYCRHGVGTIAEYVKNAEDNGRLKVLGFSEHCPLPDMIPEYATRMDYAELIPYEHEIEEEDKRSPLLILKGAECDWYKSEFSYYREELLGERGYDYLSMSIHSMPANGVETYISRIGYDLFKPQLSKYVKLYTEGLQSGIFAFGCHPDLFLADYLEWDENAKAASKDIILCAKEVGIPLELNEVGLKKPYVTTVTGEKRPQYGVREFWGLARDLGVKITTNSDAHDPKDVNGTAKDGYPTLAFKMAAELGIKFVDWDIEKGRVKAL